MAGIRSICSIRFGSILACGLLLAGSMALPGFASNNDDPESGLVRVNLVTKIRGAIDTVEINGRLLTDYQPIIVQAFSSTGMVLDHKGHIMTFLGYRWLDIQNSDLTIDVADGEGRKWKGSLVGIDQSNGVAVIKLTGAKLKKTPICTRCEIRDGTTVRAPIPQGPQIDRFAEARIVSVGSSPGVAAAGGWMMTVDRPIPDTGQPLLTADGRIIGFIASQDPMRIRNIVYPIAPLLDSANRILKEGGDIRTGWLGVFLLDAELPTGRGVMVERVEPDSPAQRAGLSARDILLKYDGHRITDSRQLIHLVQNTPIGSKVDIEIARNGNQMTIAAPVETRRAKPFWGKLSFNLPGTFGSPVPVAPVAAPEPKPTPRGLVGLDTVFLTDSLAEALQLSGQTGLLVVDVAKEMPAERAGVMVGDVITSMDGKPITDAPGFASYLMNRNWMAPVVLRVLRKGVERTITVNLDHRKTQF